MVNMYSFSMEIQGNFLLWKSLKGLDSSFTRTFMHRINVLNSFFKFSLNNLVYYICKDKIPCMYALLIFFSMYPDDSAKRC